MIFPQRTNQDALMSKTERFRQVAHDSLHSSGGLVCATENEALNLARAEGKK